MADFSPSTWFNRLPRWLVIALAIPLIGLDGWVLLQGLNYFHSIVSALVIATVLAFLLDYLAQFLQKRGMERGQAVLLIFLAALGLFAILAITLVPLLVIQLEEMVQRLPDWIDAASMQLQSFQNWAIAHRLPVNVTRLVRRLENMAPDDLESVSTQLPTIVLNAADSLIEIVLVIALTLYLLLHGRSFWRGVFRWLPQPFSDEVQQALQKNFRSYFIGQATVALIQGTALSLLFFALRLPLFLLCGMGVGLLALIPFFDLLGVLTVALLTALNNVWLGVVVLVLCLIVDQIIDNAVTPRIMGKLVGLNPVWIILSLLLGAQIAGFIGILLAIPLASTIQELVDFFYPPTAIETVPVETGTSETAPVTGESKMSQIG